MVKCAYSAPMLKTDYDRSGPKLESFSLKVDLLHESLIIVAMTFMMDATKDSYHLQS